MYSNIYETEKKNLIQKKVAAKKVKQISKVLWENRTIKDLIKEAGEPLDEYVRIFLGLYGEDQYSEERFLYFFKSVMNLRQEIKEDTSLIDAYKALDPEDRAIPMQALSEIIWIVTIAVLSGAGTKIGGLLIKKVMEGRDRRRTEKLVRLILSNPILSILSSHENGLSSEEIYEKANMKTEEATYFLMNFKSRGWITSESKKNKTIWKLDLDKIIKDF